jgi:uncharacterized protein with FMN-binding domain
MRRIVLALMGTLSGVVMLFSYHTSTNSEATAAAVTGSTDTSTSTSSDPAASSSSSASSSSAASSSSGTYTGDAVSTRWGTVQVQITVQNGKIVKAEAIQYPSENSKDQEINAYAVPQLNAEVVSKQSGSIDAISGATVTSNGYIQSLQSAIDQANL